MLLNATSWPQHLIIASCIFFFLTWLSLPACTFTLTTALCHLYVWLELFLCCFLYTLFPFLFILCPRKILWLQNALPVRRLAGFLIQWADASHQCHTCIYAAVERTARKVIAQPNTSATEVLKQPVHRAPTQMWTRQKKKKISNLHCGLEPWSAMLPLWHHRNRPRSFWDTITPRINWLANVPYILQLNPNFAWRLL